jgi:hypothetical protein
MGFFWFRIALCFGTLLGAMEAAHRLLAREAAAAPVPASAGVPAVAAARGAPQGAG